MSKKTVFILQDTKETCDDIQALFAESGEYFVAGTSTDGISAIAAVAEKKPDFLITELVLAGYDGLSVIDKVKSMGTDVKVIVLSALCREEIVSRAVAAGADYFMAKPINFKVLTERMKEIAKGGDSRVSTSGESLHRVSLEEKVSKIYINVGITPHINGYSFL